MELTSNQTIAASLAEERRILRNPINEMANLNATTTGLPVTIWVGEVGGQHGPCIKVSNTPGKFDTSSNFVVAVARKPYTVTPRAVDLPMSTVEDIYDWISLNYEVLMELYTAFETGDGDTVEIMSRLQKL